MGVVIAQPLLPETMNPNISPSNFLKQSLTPGPSQTSCNKKDFEIFSRLTSRRAYSCLSRAVSTATSSREQELLDQVASLQALLNKPHMISTLLLA
ncbi:hypothetical protein RIR_jg20084.t1 [Rhizophagus irregularis DAOM 181602=DAOM 197198]|nr:hypothetical protein RIR_jg20084.t1 [Rhizophagus irregularis DAOM 181602=DAOM 197198]